MKICTVDEIAALDKRAAEEHRIPEAILMENAGLAVCEVIRREVGIHGRRFVVLCGAGNNGGDGFVIARKLLSGGGDVRAFVLGKPASYSGAAGQNYDTLVGCGVRTDLDADAGELAAALAGVDAAVDALLGTGITRDVEGRYRAAVEALNSSGVPVYSVDIPSGVDGNTGRARGVAVRAAATVTFGLPKRGNLLHPGADLCGRLYVSHISYPPSLAEPESVLVEVNVTPRLPPREVYGHKGSFGQALFVAGSANYFGAPSLSSLSYLKAGGGYSRLAAPRSLVPHLAPLASEVVFLPQAETADGSLAADAEGVILDVAAHVDFVVLGPGLSLVEETQRLVRRLAAQIDKPLLIDGDGLTAVSAELDVVRGRGAPTALTPHPGEMSRLVGATTAEIVADPLPIAQEAAKELGAVVVLKGAHSLIALPDRRVFVNLTGNSGMGSAGSGDVLTGTIAAMHGLGLAFEDAVRTGVFLHGLAGDAAATARGEDGITARDVLDGLPAALRRYREDFQGVTGDFCGQIEVL